MKSPFKAALKGQFLLGFAASFKVIGNVPVEKLRQPVRVYSVLPEDFPYCMGYGVFDPGVIDSLPKRKCQGNLVPGDVKNHRVLDERGDFFISKAHNGMSSLERNITVLTEDYTSGNCRTRVLSTGTIL
ncbi:MAG: hypothetical protein IKN79_10605, partial [Eubacterium sp.]|nr:hypothetical protein [Eubacterium sp.]